MGSRPPALFAKQVFPKGHKRSSRLLSATYFDL